MSDQDKDLWQYFQKLLDKKLFKSYLYYHYNLQCQLYNLLLNWYLLKVQMSLGYANKKKKKDSGTF